MTCLRFVSVVLLMVACNATTSQRTTASTSATPWCSTKGVIDRFTRLDEVLPTCTFVQVARRAAVPAGHGSKGSHGGSDVSYEHGDHVRRRVQRLLRVVGRLGRHRERPGDGLRGRHPEPHGARGRQLLLDTTGPVTVDHADGTLEVELSGFQVPQPWQPGTPTAASPDQITVEQLLAAAVGTDEPTLTLVDVRMDRVGAVPEITVTDGKLAVGGGYLELSTPPGQPLTIENLLLGGGGLSLVGADGVTLDLVMAPAQPWSSSSAWTASRSMDMTFDCSPSTPLLLELFPG